MNETKQEMQYFRKSKAKPKFIIKVCLLGNECLS